MDNIFYVYVHRKPNGEVFYVGKGKGKRAWSQHGRNLFWRKTVAKYDYVVEIVDDGLMEFQAFELEEFLISLYGRRENGGVLVNLTDGGEGSSGYLHTEAVKQKLSAARSGSNNPTADHNIYTFVNISGEVIKATKIDFDKQTGLKASSLFLSGKNRANSIRGWRLEGNLNKVRIVRFLQDETHTFINVNGVVIKATRRDFEKQTGIDPSGLFQFNKYRIKTIRGWRLDAQWVNNFEEVKSQMSAEELHTFENADGESICATRTGFRSQTGIDPRCLFGKDKLNSTHGWRLKGNLEEIKAYADQNEVHTFQHVDGSIVIATRTAFKNQTGVDTEGLFGKRKRNHVKGWYVGEKPENIVIKPPPDQIYTFVNIDGTVITTTRCEFKERTGIEPRSLFRCGKNKAKVTRTGWSLLPAQP